MIYQIIVTIAGFIAFLNIAAAAYLFFLKYRKKKKMLEILGIDLVRELKQQGRIDEVLAVQVASEQYSEAIDNFNKKRAAATIHTIQFTVGCDSEEEKKDLPDNVVDFNSLKKEEKDE